MRISAGAGKPNLYATNCWESKPRGPQTWRVCTVTWTLTSFHRRRGYVSFLKYFRTFCSFKKVLISGETWPEPNLLRFHQSAVEVGEGKYPTPAPGAIRTTREQGGGLRNTCEAHNPEANTKRLRPNNGTENPPATSLSGLLKFYLE